jgi:cold shock CspA family protein
MTSFQRLIRFAFLASSTMLTLAWVSRPPFSGSRTTAPTRLYMFDWFNPKPAPKPQEIKEEVPAAPAAAAVVAVQPVGANNTTKSTSASSDAIHSGTVSWFDRKKGFGFIDSSGGKDEKAVFVHQSQIQMEGYRCLVEGEKVEYRLEHDETGRARAVHVTGPNGGEVKVSKRRSEKKAT